MSRLGTTLALIAGACPIGFAMVLAALGLTVTGPRGTTEKCGPSIGYFAPADPAGMSPGSDERAIFDACKTADLGRNGWVLLSGFPGFLVVGGSGLAWAIRSSRRPRR